LLNAAAAHVQLCHANIGLLLVLVLLLLVVVVVVLPPLVGVVSVRA
jgi:hypothetical protein